MRPLPPSTIPTNHTSLTGFAPEAQGFARWRPCSARRRLHNVVIGPRSITVGRPPCGPSLATMSDVEATYDHDGVAAEDVELAGHGSPGDRAGAVPAARRVGRPARGRRRRPDHRGPHPRHAGQAPEADRARRAVGRARRSSASRSTAGSCRSCSSARATATGRSPTDDGCGFRPSIVAIQAEVNGLRSVVRVTLGNDSGEAVGIADGLDRHDRPPPARRQRDRRRAAPARPGRGVPRRRARAGRAGRRVRCRRRHDRVRGPADRAGRVGLGDRARQPGGRRRRARGARRDEPPPPPPGLNPLDVSSGQEQVSGQPDAPGRRPS